MSVNVTIDIAGPGRGELIPEAATIAIEYAFDQHRRITYRYTGRTLTVPGGTYDYYETGLETFEDGKWRRLSKGEAQLRRPDGPPRPDTGSLTRAIARRLSDDLCTVLAVHLDKEATDARTTD